MADEEKPSVIGVASQTIGALHGAPFLLVVVLLNAIFIGAAAYYFKTQQANVAHLVEQVLTRCLPGQSERP